MLFLFKQLRMALILCCMKKIVVNTEPSVPWGEPMRLQISRDTLRSWKVKGRKPAHISADTLADVGTDSRAAFTSR